MTTNLLPGNMSNDNKKGRGPGSNQDPGETHEGAALPMSISEASATRQPIRSVECIITEHGHVCLRADGLTPIYFSSDACIPSARVEIAQMARDRANADGATLSFQRLAALVAISEGLDEPVSWQTVDWLICHGHVEALPRPADAGDWGDLATHYVPTPRGAAVIGHARRSLS